AGNVRRPFGTRGGLLVIAQGLAPALVLVEPFEDLIRPVLRSRRRHSIPPRALRDSMPFRPAPSGSRCGPAPERPRGNAAPRSPEDQTADPAIRRSAPLPGSEGRTPRRRGT